MTGGGPADGNDLIGWLATARLQLQPARRHPGYDTRDVDAFLGSIDAALKRGEQPDPERASMAQFRTARVRSGYDRQSVDALLDELQQRLRGADVPSGQTQTPYSSADGLMQRIRSARFGVTRGPGYDEEDVDTFLERIVATLARGGPLTAAEVRGAQFRITRIRPGYVQQDVDNLLEQIERYADGYGL